jgi:hypothetical protein
MATVWRRPVATARQLWTGPTAAGVVLVNWEPVPVWKKTF